MKIYSIGFTKKSAEDFFELLVKNKVSRVIDIRLNNASQLAGFAKGTDLKYLLKKIANIQYSHHLEFAPSKELLNGYKSGDKTWNDYIVEYNNILKTRKVIENIDVELLDNSCFLCSEHEPIFCHRRLLAEAIKDKYPETEIIHLQ